MDTPEKIIRESDIDGLLSRLTINQKWVHTHSQRLELLCQEARYGSFAGNRRDGHSDKIQDAQVELNRSLDLLIQDSSQLLSVNLSLSKQLCERQDALQQQQELSGERSDALERQHSQLVEQQQRLGLQQADLRQANQGLMEAQAISCEQAKALVGCVQFISEAEARIGSENRELLADCERRLDDAVKQCLTRLTIGLSEINHRHTLFKRHFDDAFWTQSQYANSELERFSRRVAEFAAEIEQRLSSPMDQLLERTAVQDAALQQLRESVSIRMRDLQQGMAASLEREVSLLSEKIEAAEISSGAAQQAQTDALQAQRASLERELRQLSSGLSHNAAALESLGQQLTAWRTEQRHSAGRIRQALGATACLLVLSLGWQIARYF